MRGAWRFGIPYSRAARLQIPMSLNIRGRRVPIRLPQESGVTSDILGCLLEDVYGLGKLGSPPATILDVGANVGIFGLAARSYFSDAVIHAYEPNPTLSHYIGFQARQFGFNYFPEAVGGQPGRINMDLPAGADCNLGRTVDTETGSIPKIGLDEAVDRLGGSVDLLKLDCEGAEWEMLLEARCWPSISRLALEYHLFRGETHQMMVEEINRIEFCKIRHVYDPACHYGHLWAINPTKLQGW